MNSSQELLYVVDENNNPQDPKPRDIVHRSRLWHRTTAIWVINDKKQILCQKRSMTKDLHPGIWESCFGGHVLANETPEDNATAELTEELGIKPNAKSFLPINVFKRDKPNHKTFQYVYAVILDNDNTDFKFQKEEIDQVCWKDIDEIKNILLDKKDSNWVTKPSDQEVLNWINELSL